MAKNKFPIWFFVSLPFDMGWEFLLFHKIRHMCDGITFFELVVNTDFFEDISPHSHNPQLQFRLIILNFTVFEITIYKRYKDGDLFKV